MDFEKSFLAGFAKGLEKQAGVGVELAKGIEGVVKGVKKHMPGVGEFIQKHPGKAGMLAGALGTAAILHATRHGDSF